MKIQRAALLKELGDVPRTEYTSLKISELQRRLDLAIQENQFLLKKLSDAENERTALLFTIEAAMRRSETEERQVADLQNHIARLRTEIWRIDNSKAPVQIFAFVLFIIVLILLFT